MEIHVQHCQSCQSTNVRNILYRKEGEPDRVFVECNDCKEFVASYKLAPLGYYHNGKGYESFIRSLHRNGDFSSGRNISNLYSRTQEEESTMFKKVIETLEEREKKK